MNDRDFDKLLKRKVSQNEKMPDEINKIFSNFEEEIRMENKSKKWNWAYITRYAAAVVLVLMLCGVGGTTYAHINGVETFLSPVLRKLGINSKYEENATIVNEVSENEDVIVEFLDIASDDTLLIAGYKIKVLNGEYPIEVECYSSINDMNVEKIAYSIEEQAENEYIYYEIFNTADIELADREIIKFDTEILYINEYTEAYSDEIGKYNYVQKRYECGFKFSEEVEIKNIVESKHYNFMESYEKESNGIKFSINDFVQSSYADTIKVKTNKINQIYTNQVMNIYKVYDSNGNIIAESQELLGPYEELEFINKIILGNNVEKKIKLVIEVEELGVGIVDTIEFDIDLTKIEEVKEKEVSYLDHEELGFSFSYDSSWEYVGKNEDYMYSGDEEREFFVFEIPSTTDYVECIPILFEVKDGYNSLQEYIDEINDNLYISPGECAEKFEESIYNFSGYEGYYIVTLRTEGYVYYNEIFAAYVDGKIYEISFGGEEKEFYNLRDTLETFVDGVKIVK